MEKFLKECLIFILLPILVLGAGGYYAYTYAMTALETKDAIIDKEQQVETLNTKVQQLMRERQNNKESEKPAKKVSKSGKIIYEVLGQQFSTEASFGIMFENIISNITKSGVKIRSIDYNYSPQNDAILQTNAAGYNACELGFITVGSYSQIQNFFKNLAKEKYLTNIYEVYLEPYDKNKTILIARFKVRLYTKTVFE